MPTKAKAAGDLNRSSGRPVVVGVADHSGWAILVVAAAEKGEPIVVDRRRVRLIETGVPSQPYEHDTLALKNTEAEQLVRTVKRSIAACTALAFDRLSADLWPGYRVTSIAIRQPTLAHISATVAEVHRSAHTRNRADGMLYHTAMCEEARQREWGVLFHRRGEELTKAAEACQAKVQDVERFIGDLRQTLKSPWTADHRNAFAAAVGGLSNRSALRIPRTDNL